MGLIWCNLWLDKTQRLCLNCDVAFTGLLFLACDKGLSGALRCPKCKKPSRFCFIKSSHFDLTIFGLPYANAHEAFYCLHSTFPVIVTEPFLNFLFISPLHFGDPNIYLRRVPSSLFRYPAKFTLFSSSSFASSYLSSPHRFAQLSRSEQSSFTNIFIRTLASIAVLHMTPTISSRATRFSSTVPTAIDHSSRFSLVFVCLPLHPPTIYSCLTAAGFSSAKVEGIFSADQLKLQNLNHADDDLSKRWKQSVFMKQFMEHFVFQLIFSSSTTMLDFPLHCKPSNLLNNWYCLKTLAFKKCLLLKLTGINLFHESVFW